MSAEQAEGISQAFAEASSDPPATKADLSGLGSELKGVRADLGKREGSPRRDIRETELKMEAKIEGAKSEILKWRFGQTLSIIGDLMALLRIGH